MKFSHSILMISLFLGASSAHAAAASLNCHLSLPGVEQDVSQPLVNGEAAITKTYTHATTNSSVEIKAEVWPRKITGTSGYLHIEQLGLNVRNYSINHCNEPGDIIDNGDQPDPACRTELTVVMNGIGMRVKCRIIQ